MFFKVDGRVSINKYFRSSKRRVFHITTQVKRCCQMDAYKFGCVAGKSYGRGWEQAGWLTVFTKFTTWNGKPANGYTLTCGRRTKVHNNWGPILYARKYIEKVFNRKKNSTGQLRKPKLDGGRTLRDVDHIDLADMEFKNIMKMSDVSVVGICFAVHVAEPHPTRRE